MQLLRAGVRVLVYSGDVDNCLPYTGSLQWVQLLGLNETAGWRPWTVSRPFPSWSRSILTEIYLCHACSCQQINIEGGNARTGGRRPPHGRVSTISPGGSATWCPSPPPITAASLAASPQIRGDVRARAATVSLKRLLDASPWLQFTSECQRL
eukprot:COSAG01_NODE_2962_length_6786_cov_21.580544_3_plen_153_part_00